MPRDRLARGVYLETLPHAAVPARHSKGARRRATQLQRFLTPLAQCARWRLDVAAGVELVVLAKKDWRQTVSYPYGFPFARTAAGRVSIVAAADYPTRLLERFEPIRLRGAGSGAAPPSATHELLDLMVGHEWGHAAANLGGLRTRVRWVDELLASYLFLAALEEHGNSELKRRFVGWAHTTVKGTAPSRADLGSFEYPRRRLGLDNLLWFQGMFTLRAAELEERWGWGFAGELKSVLDTQSRGDVARTLLSVEPSFLPWFKEFGRDHGAQPNKPAT